MCHSAKLIFYSRHLGSKCHTREHREGNILYCGCAAAILAVSVTALVI